MPLLGFGLAGDSPSVLGSFLLGFGASHLVVADSHTSKVPETLESPYLKPLFQVSFSFSSSVAMTWPGLVASCFMWLMDLIFPFFSLSWRMPISCFAKRDCVPFVLHSTATKTKTFPAAFAARA